MIKHERFVFGSAHGAKHYVVFLIGPIESDQRGKRLILAVVQFVLNKAWLGGHVHPLLQSSFLGNVENTLALVRRKTYG